MTKENPFRVISVTGAHSKSGKTTLCTILLKNLQNYGAIKFTKTPLYTSVTDDPEIILQHNTDTSKMSEAGAAKVTWVQSDHDGLEDALDIALSGMSGLDGVIVEGNSPVEFLEPDLLIFIIGNDAQIKPSALGLCKKADIIIINSDKKTDSPSHLAPLISDKAVLLHFDLMSETGELDKLISYVKKG